MAEGEDLQGKFFLMALPINPPEKYSKKLLAAGSDVSSSEAKYWRNFTATTRLWNNIDIKSLALVKHVVQELDKGALERKEENPFFLQCLSSDL